MKHSLLLKLTVSLILLPSVSVYGGIEVTLDSLNPTIEGANPWFTIRTGYTRRGIHHNDGHTVEVRLIKAGETSKIPVNFVNPLLFYETNIQLYHPAYLPIGDRTKKMPTIIRTVSFGPYELKSWRSVIDSGRPIAMYGPQIHVGMIVDQIHELVDTYIYEIDRAGKRVDLSNYLPLMEELIAYARETAPAPIDSLKHIENLRKEEQAYEARLKARGTAPSPIDSSKHIEDLRKEDPAYDARLKASMEKQFKLADSYIAQTETLLLLTPEERLKLRYRQEHIFKTKEIYYDTMEDSDREALLDFVEDQFAISSLQDNKVIEKTKLWMNPETGISYSARYNQVYRMRIDETDKYVPCIRLGLSVDLSTSIPVEIPPIWGKKSKMENEVIAKFCDYNGVKQLQLTGAEAW